MAEFEGVPVDYNPFDDPDKTLAAGAGTLDTSQAPTLDAMEQAAARRKDDFGGGWQSTVEGYPYFQSGNQPSFPETGPTAAVPPSSQPTSPVESAPSAPTEPAGKPLVLSTRQTPWDPYINTHAARAGVDPNLMRRMMQIESGGDPTNTTGSYRGLFQLSPQEFYKWGGRGNIYDPEQNTIAAANKIAGESAAFRDKYGRDPTPTDIYMVHQQGEGGYANHMARPDQPAWRNMWMTAEGQQKGPLWAQKAIWGNIPNDLKGQFGNVNNVSSRDFVNLWHNKVEGGGSFDDSAFQAAAARVRRRHPTREPDPAALAASQGMVGWGDVARSQAEGMINLPQQALQAAGELQRQGDVYNPAAPLSAAMLTMGSTPFSAPAGAIGAGPVFRPISEAVAPVFHSAVGKAIEAMKQPKASPEQWIGTLKNTPGVKPEELQWLGVEDWLKGQKGPVTKEQVADYVRGNQVELKEVTKGGGSPNTARQLAEDQGDNWETLGPNGRQQYENLARQGNNGTAKFGSYTLPGGENYREMLLQMPQRDIPPDVFAKQHYENFLRKGGERSWEQLTPVERQGYIDATQQMDMNKEPGFASSHWDEPNVLAHVRFNDRNIDGKKTLFLEEVQSDWHQAGKRKGYQQKPDTSSWTAKPSSTEPQPQDNRVPGGWWNVYDATGNRVGTTPRHSARNAEEAIADVAQREKFSGVPDAPFKTTWPELALKRMIRYAAENGYEKIAWTNGETQAARYDLSKHIANIEYSKIPTFENQEPRWVVNAFDHQGNGVMKQSASAAELPDIVGKEVADKIINAKPSTGELRGLDLKVGGEGMKGFYDKMLPAAANKLGKKFGARVQVENVDAAAKDANGMSLKFMDPDARLPVHTLDITPQLRDTAIKSGFPMFASGGLVLQPVDHNPFAKGYSTGGRVPDEDIVARSLSELYEVMGEGDTPEIYALPYKVDASHTIAYGGGVSLDGATIYIDSELYKAIAAGKVKIPGMTPKEILDHVIEHEHTEYTVDVGDNAVDVYEGAHGFAEAREHEGLDNPDLYEKRLDPFLRQCLHRPQTNPPKDLWCGPYIDHADAHDKRILRQFKKAGVYDADKVSKFEVHYGYGAQQCKGCAMFGKSRPPDTPAMKKLRNEHDMDSCSLVCGLVRSTRWCEKWEPK